MIVHELQPPEVSPLPQDALLLFLAGPIEDAPDWQSEAISTLCSLDVPRQIVHVANPRRKPATGLSNPEDTEGVWQHYNLRRAAKLGGVIFWFAAQNPSDTVVQSNEYARKSYIEFGRTLGWRDNDLSVRLTLGIEPAFGGDKRYFKTCTRKEGLIIYDSLEATCRAAVARLP